MNDERTPRALRSIACLLLVCAGCQRDVPVIPAPLAIPDDVSAVQLVNRFFTAYVNVDVDACEKLLCDADAETQARVRAFIIASQAQGSPFRITRFQTRSVELMWHGSEPYHRVEVSFPRKSGPGEVLQVYVVRAREGCLQGFVEPPSAEEMNPRSEQGDPTLPPLVPAPDARPPDDGPIVDDGREVIEL